MIPELFVSVVFLYIIVTLLRKNKSSKCFPPGPIGFPVLGHLPLLGRSPHKTLMKWRKVYGPITSVRFGSFRSVVISDTNVLREAMNTRALNGRPQISVFTVRSNGTLQGVLFRNDYHKWTEQRRFVQKHLRSFGLGTKSMEAKIMVEVEDLITGIKLRSAVHSRTTFCRAIVGAMWSIMFSERINNDSDVLQAINRMNSIVDTTSMVSGLGIFIPWINKLFPEMSGFNKLKEASTFMTGFINQRIENHNTNYKNDCECRDFVDAYTHRVQKTTEVSSTFHPKHNEISFTTMDLFAAGTETVNTTMQWLFAYLLNFPSVMKTLQEEVDRVIGAERPPCLNDKQKMPFMEAVTTEVLRMSSIVPLGVFHNCTEDLNFRGYFIPKDTMIVTNLYGCHYDPEVWGDPENFRPERFLNEEGHFQKHDHIIPFGIGKRVCLGENLARDEIFLILTSLLQTFVVTTPDGIKPSLEPIVGMTTTPPPFDMIFTEK